MVCVKQRIGAGLVAATVALAGSSWAAPESLADKPAPRRAAASAEKDPRPSKLDLTPESFAAFRELIRPSANEWRHLNVKWVTDVVAARKKAAQEDKPLLIFRTGGAGYNDPTGVC
jgi:hypothetical protein